MRQVRQVKLVAPFVERFKCAEVRMRGEWPFQVPVTVCFYGGAHPYIIPFERYRASIMQNKILTEAEFDHYLKNRHASN